MKTKILMLVGIAVSVMFLSGSAFADLTLTTERIDRDNYVEVVIKAQNDGSEDYPQVGIQSIMTEMEGEPVIQRSTVEAYSSLGNPASMRNVTEILDGDGELLESIASAIEFDDPELSEGAWVITGSWDRYLITPEGSEELVERVDFENEYNLQGVKFHWIETEWRPDPESETGFSGFRTSECRLIGSGGPLAIPSDPLYSLHAVPGGSEVDLGSVYVQKPIGDEIVPIFMYNMAVTDGVDTILAILEDYVVDPNIE